MRFSTRLMLIAKYVFLMLYPVLLRLEAALTWAWNSTTSKPWYFCLRIDKYIFVVFSWVVWAGFMRRFGLAGLKRLGQHIDNFILDAAAWLQTLPAVVTRHMFPRPSTYAFISKDVSWAGLSPAWLRGKNPHQDLDLTVTTDCEDLAAFSNDVVEFVEQDKSLLLDSLTDFGISTFAVLTVWGGAKVLSSRILKKKK